MHFRGSVISCFEHSGFSSVQGHHLESIAALKKYPRLPWHPETRLPLKSWLMADPSEKDKDAALWKERVKCVGNIVMPRMCHFALQLIAHELLSAH